MAPERAPCPEKNSRLSKVLLGKFTMLRLSARSTMPAAPTSANSVVLRKSITQRVVKEKLLAQALGERQAIVQI
jgi:hypothetical protein